MSMDSLYQIEEERRLLYVAITRAEVNCIITYATSRYHNGQTKTCVMSRFLRDIAPEYLLMGSTNTAPVPSRKRTRWDDDMEVPSRPAPSPLKRPTAPNTRTAKLPTQTVPSGPSKPAPTPPAAAANGNFTIHTADELKVGGEILHQRFGRGVVTDIDTKGDAKIDVQFSDGTPRKLLLKFAKFEIIS
jgi:DNA helicase-2/ATP-dependent DNA helicase PcrA